MTVWVVHLGRRFGLLQILAKQDSPIRMDVLARLGSLDEPAVASWCKAAHSLRILRRTGQRYLLPTELRPLLAFEDDPAYLGGQFSYLALRSLDYDGFDGLFRRGAVDRRGAKHASEAIREATRWDHTAFLAYVLPSFPGLGRLLASGARVLDLGCGAGEWDLRMAPKFPNCMFAGIDPNAAAIGLAREKAEEARLSDRLAFRVGAGESIAPSGRFDVIHLGEVLSAIAAKAEVLRNCFHALNPRGYLVIAEGLLDGGGDPYDPANQLIRAMDLDFALQGTRFLSGSELRALLRDAGFSDAKFMHVGGGLWYVLARK